LIGLRAVQPHAGQQTDQHQIVHGPGCGIAPDGRHRLGIERPRAWPTRMPCAALAVSDKSGTTGAINEVCRAADSEGLCARVDRMTRLPPGWPLRTEKRSSEGVERVHSQRRGRCLQPGAGGVIVPCAPHSTLGKDTPMPVTRTEFGFVDAGALKGLFETHEPQDL